MSAILHESSVPSFLAPRLEFSFYEQRVAEEQLVNSCFLQIGSGWWKYLLPGGAEARMHTPSWDRAYDWDAAYAKAAMTHTSNLIW